MQKPYLLELLLIFHYQRSSGTATLVKSYLFSVFLERDYVNSPASKALNREAGI